MAFGIVVLVETLTRLRTVSSVTVTAQHLHVWHLKAKPFFAASPMPFGLYGYGRWFLLVSRPSMFSFCDLFSSS